MGLDSSKWYATFLAGVVTGFILFVAGFTIGGIAVFFSECPVTQEEFDTLRCKAGFLQEYIDIDADIADCYVFYTAGIEYMNTLDVLKASAQGLECITDGTKDKRWLMEAIPCWQD